MSKATDAQRKALGKGLSALLPQRSAQNAHTPVKNEVPAQPASSPQTSEKAIARLLPLDLIQPNPDQPRQDFPEEKMAELARSITANGVIQPITVTETGPDRFLIVAGERRWRAAKAAGLKEIPAFIRAVPKERIMELALIENIQREDLNPIETAQAFEQLTTQHALTHEQIAERTGKDRSTITNFLRLLRLTAPVREYVAAGTISMGHARALLGLEQPETQVQACKQVVEKGLSVRETEQLVKTLMAATGGDAKQTAAKATAKVLDANTRAALEEMAMVLGTKVKIVPRSEKSGKLEIEYYSTEDLQRIYEAIVPGR